MKFNALRARIAWPALDNDCNKDSMIVMDFAAGFLLLSLSTLSIWQRKSCRHPFRHHVLIGRPLCPGWLRGVVRLRLRLVSSSRGVAYVRRACPGDIIGQQAVSLFYRPPRFIQFSPVLFTVFLWYLCTFCMQFDRQWRWRAVSIFLIFPMRTICLFNDLLQMR